MKYMEDSSTIIVLLTITVIMLAAVIIALLGVVAVLVYRINRIVKHIESVSKNVAEATAWFTPSKLVGSILDLFNR